MTATAKKKPSKKEEFIFMKNLSGAEVRVRNTKENIDYLKKVGWTK